MRIVVLLLLLYFEERLVFASIISQVWIDSINRALKRHQSFGKFCVQLTAS